MAAHCHLAPAPESLDTLSEILHRRTVAAGTAAGASRYLLIGTIAKLLVELCHRELLPSGWIMLLQHCRDLHFAAARMGSAAAATLEAAGGVLAGADVLASFVTCCAVGSNLMDISLKNVTALYHIAAPGVPDSVMRDKAAQAALALEGQQMILLRLQHEDASRDALCQEVPGSLPAAANGVLTCDRGAAAVDAMMVAAKVGLMICSTLYEACHTDRPLPPDLRRTVPRLVAGLAALLAALIYSRKTTDLAAACPGQHPARKIAAALMGYCGRMAAQLSAACCRLRQQLQLSVLSHLDRAAILTCSSRAGASLLKAAEKWGRTGCWDDDSYTKELRGGWPSMAYEAAALLHTMTAQPPAKQSAATRALQEADVTAVLQQMGRRWRCCTSH